MRVLRYGSASVCSAFASTDTWLQSWLSTRPAIYQGSGQSRAEHVEEKYNTKSSFSDWTWNASGLSDCKQHALRSSPIGSQWTWSRKGTSRKWLLLRSPGFLLKREQYGILDLHRLRTAVSSIYLMHKRWISVWSGSKSTWPMFVERYGFAYTEEVTARAWTGQP
jgi:hypothetical protein